MTERELPKFHNHQELRSIEENIITTLKIAARIAKLSSLLNARAILRWERKK